MNTYPITDQNRVRRVPKRGRYDQETVFAILDAGLICHVGLVEGEQPVVIPTIHARDGESLLLHGATTSRLIQYAQSGRPLCVTVTHLDGLVLARSVFHHSMNYRSAVLFGRGHLIEGDEAKMAALERFTEKLIPGRWAEARLPNDAEMKATAVVAIPIDMASAKIRTGAPGDDAEDIALPIWAGIVPITQQMHPPVDAPDLPDGIPVPDYVTRYVQRGG